MTSATVTPNFSRGGAALAAAEEAEQEARAARRAAASGRRTEYFKLEKGETKIIRFVEEEKDWTWVKMFSFVPTKPAPDDLPAGKKWPKALGAVDRLDKAFSGIYTDCYISENVPDQWNPDRMMRSQTRIWTKAVEREEVLCTQAMIDAGDYPQSKLNKRVGIKDVEIEVDTTNEKGEKTGTELVKKFVILQFALKNFFNQFLAYSAEYDTLMDRDYKIKRQGEGKDTDYVASPVDPVKTESGEYLDLREEKFAKEYENDIDILSTISYMASDEYYHRYFDPNFTVPYNRSGNVSTEKSEQKSDLPEDSSSPEKVNESVMGDIRDKVKSLGRKPVDA